MASNYTFEGIVINRFNGWNADKLITFFTKEHGRLTLVAKSLRKNSSKRAGVLELFNRVRAGAISTKSGIDILTEVELLESHSIWKKHLGRVNMAYQMCEAIEKLTPESVPQEEIYDLLMGFFTIDVSEAGKNWQDNLKCRLVNLMEVLGYWPSGKPFTQNIYEFIENVSGKKFSSHSVLESLSNTS